MIKQIDAENTPYKKATWEESSIFNSQLALFWCRFNANFSWEFKLIEISYITRTKNVHRDALRGKNIDS